MARTFSQTARDYTSASRRTPRDAQHQSAPLPPFRLNANAFDTLLPLPRARTQVVLRIRPTLTGIGGEDPSSSSAVGGGGGAGGGGIGGGGAIVTSTMNTTTNNNTAAAAAAAVVAATGAECIHAVGACSISISAPEGSQAYKTGERGGMYSFSRVSGPRTEQGNFFEGTAAPLVRAMVNGGQSENVIMSYGVTSSGKTYTIEGTQQAPGLIYRAVATLFKELDEQRKVGAEVFVSHYEVYNEQIFDLLTNGNPIGGRRCLQLKEDAAGRPTIMGLTDVRVPTAQAAMDT